MGVNLKVRSCRYMPPEDYSHFGDRKSSQYFALGARSYSDISRRFARVSGAGQFKAGRVPFHSIRSFLARLGFFR